MRFRALDASGAELLIDWYYSNERPIAHERRYAVGRATTPVERQAVDSVLAGFFERDGDVWRHDRIDEEISKARKYAVESFADLSPSDFFVSSW